VRFPASCSELPAEVEQGDVDYVAVLRLLHTATCADAPCAAADGDGLLNFGAWDVLDDGQTWTCDDDA
jgi:hypothetical protein